jgi:hypothetical protein
MFVLNDDGPVLEVQQPTYAQFETYRGRYRDRWQEQNWVLALRRLIFHDPGNRRLSSECPVRRKHGAVLGAIKTKPLRGGLKARLDSPCAQRPSMPRPGRRNGPSNRTKKLALLNERARV